MRSFRERFKKINLNTMIIPIAFIMLNDWVNLLHDFARSAKIKCGGFDWTKFHTFKHVHLSLISVVYLLYLIIIGTFLCACLCINIWRITAILLAFYETKGILVILTMWCVPYVGGSQVGPIHPWWSFSGDNLARRKARWQALRFTSGSKRAGAGGQRVASGSGFSSSGFSSGSECARACSMKSCIRKPKSISQRVQESDCTMIRNVNYFSEVFGAELI